jgi:hypothetical protein
MAALLADLGRHRRADPEPGAQHLALRLVSQHHQQGPMIRFVEVDGALRFRQPQWDSKSLQGLDCSAGFAAAGERPFELADHNRIKGSVMLGRCGQQRRRLRTFGPRQAPRGTRVEELHRYPAPAGDKPLCRLHLPRP